MAMYLRRRAQFSAGFLHAPAGEIGGGHNYRVELTVGGEIDPRSGMVVNITDVDAVLKTRVVRPLARQAAGPGRVRLPGHAADAGEPGPLPLGLVRARALPAAGPAGAGDALADRHTLGRTLPP